MHRINAPYCVGSQGRFTGIGFESRTRCPSGFRCWPGKRKVYQVIRLFFTGGPGCVAWVSTSNSPRKALETTGKLTIGVGHEESFLVSSFNLYAFFALLGVVRFIQTTVSIGAAWIAKHVAGNRHHTCVYRCITSTRHSRAPSRTSLTVPTGRISSRVIQIISWR